MRGRTLRFVMVCGLFFAPVDPVLADTSASEALRHAETWYQLGHARDNGWFELLRSAEYAHKAELGASKTQENIRQAATQQRQLAETQAAQARGKFSGAFPVLTSIRGAVVHQTSSSPRVSAGRAAVAALHQRFDATIQEKDAQPYVVVTTHPRDPKVEAAVGSWLRHHTVYHVIGVAALHDALSSQDIDALYRQEIPLQPAIKLAAAFKQDAVSVIRVAERDVVDRVHHAVASYRQFDVDGKQLTIFVHADGFAEHTPERKKLGVGLLALMVLLAVLAGWLFRRNAAQRANPHRAPLWFDFVAVLMSMAIVLLSLRGLSSAAPAPSSAFPSVATLAWLAATAFSLAIVPAALVYFLGLRLPKVAPHLRNADTLTALIFATLAGGVGVVGFFGIQRFPPVHSVWPVGMLLVMSLVSAYVVGRGLSNLMLSGATAAPGAQTGLRLAPLVSTVGQLLALWVGVACLFGWTSDKLITGGILFVVLSGLAQLLGRWLGSDGDIGDAADRVESTTDGPLSLLAEDFRPAFVEPSGRPLAGASEFLKAGQDDELIEFIVINGERGAGRSRFIDELAARWRTGCDDSDRQEPLLLRGACSDPALCDDTDVPPYEVFSRAFSEWLKPNELATPGSSVEGLREKLSNVGAGAGLSLIGLGALSTLIEPEKAPGQKMVVATQSMLSATLESLLARVSEDRAVMLVLEDVQWMDENTVALFKRLLESLMPVYKENSLCIVLSAVSLPGGRSCEAVEFLRDLHEERLIGLHEVEPEQLRLDEEQLCQLLQNMQVHVLDAKAMTPFLIKNDVWSPGEALETMRHLVREGALEDDGGGKLQIRAGQNVQDLPVAPELTQRADRDIGGLDRNVIDILECAAIIGRRFRANVLAKIFKIDAIEMLARLRRAEDAGILEDVVGEDQIFAFHSSRVVLALQARVQAAGAGQRMKQLAREYNERYLDVVRQDLLDRYGTLEAAPVARVCALASQAQRIAGVVPQQALRLNLVAARLRSDSESFEEANRHFEALFEIQASTNLLTSVDSIQARLAYARSLFESGENPSLAAAQLDQAKTALASARSEGTDPDALSRLEARWRVLRTRQLFEQRDFPAAARMAAEVVAAPAARDVDRLRARFYGALSVGEASARVQLLKGLLVSVESALSALARQSTSKKQALEVPPGEQPVALELNGLLGEVLNSLGRGLLSLEWGAGRELLERAYEHNQRAEPGARRSFAITCGALGDAYNYFEPRDVEKARSYYSQNLADSKQMGDREGIIAMTSKLAKLLLDAGEYGEAKGLYQESLYRADMLLKGAPNNKKALESCAWALAGLFETAVASDTGPSTDILAMYDRLHPRLVKLSGHAAKSIASALGRMSTWPSAKHVATSKWAQAHVAEYDSGLL